MNKNNNNHKSKFRIEYNQVLIIFIMFSLSFLIRFICLQQVKQSPFFENPIIDAAGYDSSAIDMANSSKTLDSGEAFYQAPLYTYFLALQYKIFGHNYFLARIIQIIISSLSCILLYLIALRLFNTPVAIISSIIYSLYGPIIFYDLELLKPFMTIFFNLLGMFILLLVLKSPSWKKWFLSGIVFGLAVLTREDTFLFVFFICIWIWLIFHKTKPVSVIFSYIVALCLGIGIIVLPVTIRNYIVKKDFVLVSKTGGLNFYIGNMPKTEYYLSLQPGYEWLKLSNMPYEATGSNLKSSAWSNWYYKEAFKFIIAHPFDWSRIMLKKLIIFLNGYEYEPNYDINYIKTYSLVLRITIFKLMGLYYPFGIIAPFAFIGMFLLIKKQDIVGKMSLLYFYILAYSAAVVFFLVKARYRITIVPVVIIFSSFAIYQLWNKIAKNEYKLFGGLMIALLVLLGLFNYSFYKTDAHNHFPLNYYMGRDYVKHKDYDNAIEEFKKAIEINPDSTDAHNELAMVYEKKGLQEDAFAECMKALELAPDYAEAFATLGTIYNNINQNDKAINAYKQAVSHANKLTDLAGIYFNLGIIYMDKKAYDDAILAFKNSLEYDTSKIAAYQNIGAMYLFEKEYNEAEKFYLKAIELFPNSYECHYNLGLVYSEKGMYDLAIRELTMANKLNPVKVLLSAICIVFECGLLNLG